MLTRRGACRQRGMDLPKIQTDITGVEGAMSPMYNIGVEFDADLDLFTQVDYSCLDFLTPTSRRSSNTNSSTTTDTPETGSSAGVGDDDDDVPWPRPMDRDIHGRSALKRTAPQWAIRVRLVLSKDFEQDSSASQGWDDSTATQWQRRPSVVDRRYSYGRKIQGGRGRRPSDFSLRSAPQGLAVHYEEVIPFELVLCSEENSLYSN
ncbi:hypothetical protein F5883DRAFT_643658 [Diaporthe sp. PMI_573]|nr:hypothetical protein F5883DRAFT_643658 [Diaporthaceae sp. PMI_573]